MENPRRSERNLQQDLDPMGSHVVSHLYFFSLKFTYSNFSYTPALPSQTHSHTTTLRHPSPETFFLSSMQHPSLSFLGPIGFASALLHVRRRGHRGTRHSRRCACCSFIVLVAVLPTSLVIW